MVIRRSKPPSGSPLTSALAPAKLFYMNGLGSALGPEEVRAELDRIRASPKLNAKKKPLEVLGYLVNRKLEDGDAVEIDQKDIAQAVWPKVAFDTSKSLVRSTVSQLRSLLQKYYATDGQNDAIRIGLPTVGYVPFFERHRPKTAADVLKKKQVLPRLSWSVYLSVVVLIVILVWGYRDVVSNADSSVFTRLQSLRSDKIQLSNSQHKALDEFTQDMTSFLSAELSKKGTSPFYRAWTIAQIVVSLRGRAEIEEPALRDFFNQQKESCNCWRQQPGHPGHVAATAWVLTALARIERPATHEELLFLLKNQNPEGWWPIFPSNGDRINASTYATTWALLALSEQVRKHFVPAGDLEDVIAAIQGGRAWLLKTQIEGKARWDDYPFAVERIESVSLSGLVVHALHVSGEGGYVQIDRLWLDEIPSSDSLSLLTDERSSRAVDLAKGGFERDATRNYMFPWILIATADAYPNGDWSERAKGLGFVKRSVERLGELRGRLRELPWTAAEFEIALRYLEDNKKVGGHLI